jgi:hypothetical protein
MGMTARRTESKGGNMPDAEQAKDALKNDWEQTKADMPGDAGQDKDQDVDDTLRQAAGKQSTDETD